MRLHRCLLRSEELKDDGVNLMIPIEESGFVSNFISYLIDTVLCTLQGKILNDSKRLGGKENALLFYGSKQYLFWKLKLVD